jgi:hypothetical protein
MSDNNAFNFNESNSSVGPYRNSIILNEIHNLFPALLYDSAQFQTVGDIFAYVDRRMDTLYNVYTTQINRYETSRPSRPSFTSAEDLLLSLLRTSIVVESALDLSGAIAGTRPPPPAPTLAPQTLTNQTTATPIGRASWYVAQNFFNRSEPPSFQQITRGSTIINAASELECTICQNTVNSGHLIRRLNTCTHSFHMACIDVWFQTNSTCPMCRHDIRN